jgi:hypothetical protein
MQRSIFVARSVSEGDKKMRTEQERAEEAEKRNSIFDRRKHRERKKYT